MSAKTTNRPQALQVRQRGIPDELKARPQWCNWKYARAGEKWTKHPYNPRTGRKASSTDLLTWSPFDVVFEAYEAGGYDGIGFVFCSGDPYTGVDLDGCRDQKTGEVEPWAAKIIRDFDSFTELSPSGTGFHILVRGGLPGGGRKRGFKRGCKRGSIEIYDMKRFFTVTGHVAGVVEVRAA